MLCIERCLFPNSGKNTISDKHGVYIIYGLDNRALHVGRTKAGKQGLNQRLSNHMKNQSSFSREYLNSEGSILRNGYKFKFIMLVYQVNPEELFLPTSIHTGHS